MENVEISKDFRSRDGNVPSPGAAGPRRWPDWQFSPRADSTSTSQLKLSYWCWVFHTVRNDYDSGGFRLDSLTVVVVKVWNDVLSGDET